MNDVIFTSGFMFLTIMFDRFHYTDNRAGVQCHYFAQLLSGQCRIVTDTETIEIHKGDIFYIPNKCSYQSYRYGEPEIKFISLSFLYLPNFDNKAYPVQVIPYNEAAAKLFNSLSSLHRLSAYDVGVFYTLVGILMPLITTDMPIEHISDFLQFSSTSYFRKKFKQYFNMTPKEMRKRYRI